MRMHTTVERSHLVVVIVVAAGESYLRAIFQRNAQLIEIFFIRIKFAGISAMEICLVQQFLTLFTHFF